MNPMRRVSHLVRRWTSSLDRSPLDRSELDHVRSVLLDEEWRLWQRMTLADRRHSIVVANRFVTLVPDATDAEVAAAYLHDVGKCITSMSTTERVVATLIAPVHRPRRFSAYYEHESIGLDLCRAAGSRERTLALLSDPDDRLGEALRRSDDL